MLVNISFCVARKLWGNIEMRRPHLSIPKSRFVFICLALRKEKGKGPQKKEKTMHVSYVYVVDTENALIEANQDFYL
ncbi:Uncharacterized protein APZ42_016788 [Daphnia magna]|uniref:Uncharacterized protein n=1 Tax=Daphnia magna TaxID=35525 RepID=A0A165A4P5_9CRUS|nr:Uncharacterized protein APZ42_016788 [Daphnia magna]